MRKRVKRKPAAKRNQRARKPTKGRKRKTTRKRGRPLRAWSAAELAAILDDTSKGASLTFLAKKHACARSSMHRLTCRADFSDAYRGARAGSVIHAELAMLDEGLGGRKIVKTAVETVGNKITKTTTTTEFAEPHVGALSKYLAAYGGTPWSNRIEVTNPAEQRAKAAEVLLAILGMNDGDAKAKAMAAFKESGIATDAPTCAELMTGIPDA